MRSLIIAAVVFLCPAFASAQYWVPHQAWGYRPSYRAPYVGPSPQFQQNVWAHQQAEAARRARLSPWQLEMERELDAIRLEMFRRRAHEAWRRGEPMGR